MFHSNPYYYWSLMSVVMYVGIVCSVLVLMIMFTDTAVCSFMLYFYWLNYCVHCCLYYSACSHNGKDDVENILSRGVCMMTSFTDLRVYFMMWVQNFEF